jgi:allophanate hydrolase subunit 2
MSQDSDRTGIRLESPEVRCKPGDGIQFGAVSLDEAGLALQEMEDRINDLKRKIN